MAGPGYDDHEGGAQGRRTAPNSSIPYLVKKEAGAGLTGKYIKRAYVSRNPMSNQPEITFDVEQRRARSSSAKITRENVGQHLAIVLDGELYSAPVIQAPILGGSGRDHGRLQPRRGLRAGQRAGEPARAPLKIIESQRSGPDAGQGLHPQRHQGRDHRHRRRGRSSCWSITCSPAWWPTSR